MTSAAGRAPARHALVVSDGEAPVRATLDRNWPGWADGVDLIVAADGGALVAERLGLRPDLVVGDGDSLGDAGVRHVRDQGIPVDLAPVDKDESDTELAVRACLARNAGRITIVGAFGGRLDHTLANIWLLVLPSLQAYRVLLVGPRERVSLIQATGAAAPVHRELAGRVGDLVSLFPLGGDVTGITTQGLRYPLRDEALVMGPSRGLSNVRSDPRAALTVRSGLLLIVEVIPD